MKRELLDPKEKLKFVNSYDVIMIQQNLFNSVTLFLGQPCFKTKTFVLKSEQYLHLFLFRYPLPIDTEAPNFRENILTANSFGNLVCEPNQVHVQIRFGNTLQSTTKLYENFEDVLSKAADFLPGGLFNLQVVRMQTGTGPALPVYVDFGNFEELGF